MTDNIDKQHLESRAVLASRQCFANILRVLAGAGKSQEIVHDSTKLVEAYLEYAKLTEWFPGDQVAYSLHDVVRHAGQGSDDENYALEDVLRGSLRLIASRLLDQSTQAIAAERLLRNGIEEFNKARAKRPSPYV